jgi:hypothetical protein
MTPLLHQLPRRRRSHNYPEAWCTGVNRTPGRRTRTILLAVLAFLGSLYFLLARRPAPPAAKGG